jgi:hypothetical protein
MSVFSFPRLHIKGLIRVDVGTANNDDYSGQQVRPGSPFAGQPVRLADSNRVQALTYGMTDAEWIEWAHFTPSRHSTTDSAHGATPRFPASPAPLWWPPSRLLARHQPGPHIPSETGCRPAGR